jgi:hypothetical protein
MRVEKERKNLSGFHQSKSESHKPNMRANKKERERT